MILFHIYNVTTTVVMSNQHRDRVPYFWGQWNIVGYLHIIHINHIIFQFKCMQMTAFSKIHICNVQNIHICRHRAGCRNNRRENIVNIDPNNTIKDAFAF